MKRLFLLTLFLGAISVAFAQDDMNSQKAQISQIKQQEDRYIYADKTCATSEQALSRAKESLEQEVIAFLQQKENTSDNAEAVSEFIADNSIQILIPRGDKFRAFLYVDKDSIRYAVSHNLRKHPVKDGNLKSQAALPPSKQAASVADIPGKTALQMQPAIEASSTSANPQSSANTKNDDILSVIATFTSKLKLYDYIQELKKEGVDIEYKMHVPASDAQCYLIFYKRNGTIEAILTPGAGYHDNLLSGEPDSARNHPNCSIDGFLMK